MRAVGNGLGRSTRGVNRSSDGCIQRVDRQRQGNGGTVPAAFLATHADSTDVRVEPQIWLRTNWAIWELGHGALLSIILNFASTLTSCLRSMAPAKHSLRYLKLASNTTLRLAK